MNKFLIINVFVFVFLLTACTAEKHGQVDLLKPEQITLITKVLPYGEVGYAVICDYGTDVESESLTIEDFLVEVTVNEKITKRNISRFYMNDVPQVGVGKEKGRYLILELNPKDLNASTFTFDMSRFLNERNQLLYSITQLKDVKTENNTTFSMTPERIACSKVNKLVVDDFQKLNYDDGNGNSMKFGFFEPNIEEGKTYPLILFLHGSGERGSDNEMQLLGNQGAVVWATPEQQAENPCYVLAPQAKAETSLDYYWSNEPNYRMVMGLLKETMGLYPVDTDRIYIIGMSNGGIGTWYFIQKNPELFAAAVPICGIPNIEINGWGTRYSPLQDSSTLENIKNMPIWVFHAADDPLVDVRYSRDAVSAIQDLGGTAIKYTEYPIGEVVPSGHFSWVPALQDEQLIKWLFDQRNE